MTDIKNQWNIEMALEVLQSKTVDSATWSEAVKWLLLYGPPALRELLGQASIHATSEHFPELTPTGYDENGEPYYDLQQLAQALGLSEEDLLEKIVEMEAESGVPQLRGQADVQKVH